MIGYILTKQQQRKIQGVFFASDIFFNCVQDINDVWFLFLSEQDKALLPQKYLYILDLPTDEFVPPPTPDPFQ